RRTAVYHARVRRRRRRRSTVVDPGTRPLAAPGFDRRIGVDVDDFLRLLLGFDQALKVNWLWRWPGRGDANSRYSFPKLSNHVTVHMCVITALSLRGNS